MNSTLSLVSPARTFVRGLIARSIVGNTDELINTYSRARWGDFQGTEITKAAISAVSSSDVGGVDAGRVFFGLAREQSVLGRLQGLRRVPFNVRMSAVASGAKGYWVSQAASKPLSKPVLTGSTLSPTKVASIVVFTQEALRAADEAAEATLQDDLLRAISGTLDETFLDPTNSGIADTMPAAITNGAIVLSATGDFGADLRAMIEAFQGDLSFASFVTDPGTAVAIATMTDAGGRYLFPGMGPRGGELLGIPVLTSHAGLTNSSGGTLALIDASGISAALGSMTLDQSEHATLQMSDAPNDAGSPVFSVSLYQTNSVAWRCEVAANWSRQRPNSVVVLEGL